MGRIRSEPPLVLPIFAAFSGSEALLDSVPALLAGEIGPLALVGTRFAFTQTSYYERSMGAGLVKQFFAGAEAMPADRLPALKIRANEIEESVRASGSHDVERPLNLDPGYVDAGKLVLASTKDHAHRLYLGSGIYGEVTLHYRDKTWTPWPWTYPDYRLESTHRFLDAARAHFRAHFRALPDDAKIS